MTKARTPAATVAFVDEYCAHYRAVFSNVRHFEQFSQLVLGLLAETKRKSLPRLATTVKGDHQALHHFLAKARWSEEEVGAIRLRLTREALGGRACILCIDETGDRKKGKTTDYAASQYIGNLHGLANGVVSVNAYGVLDSVTFPLAFRFFKPKSRLKPGDSYKSKPQLVIELIQELTALGFRFSVVLADSLYGESGEFTAALHRLGLTYVVAIRSHHGVWMVPGQRLRRTRWRPFERLFTDGTHEQRFIRETIFGARSSVLLAIGAIVGGLAAMYVFALLLRGLVAIFNALNRATDGTFGRGCAILLGIVGKVIATYFIVIFWSQVVLILGYILFIVGGLMLGWLILSFISMFFGQDGDPECGELLFLLLGALCSYSLDTHSSGRLVIES